MQAKSMAHSRLSNRVSSCPVKRTEMLGGGGLPCPLPRGAGVRSLLELLWLPGGGEQLLPS